MSFLAGIEKEITNFFSGASDTFSGVVNFGSNIVNGVQNAVQGVLHSIGNIAQGLYNGLLSIGNDIANIFGQIGGAIWHGLVSFATSFGTFFFEGLHTIASAVYGAFQRIGSALEFVGKWIWSGITHVGEAFATLGQWLYSGIREIGADLLQLVPVFQAIYTDIKDFFITIWNGLVAVGEDIVNAWDAYVRAVEDAFNNLANFVTTPLHEIMYAPEEISKYVASKVSQVLPRVVSYNLFFEEMKALDRLTESMARGNNSLRPLLVKIASPFIAGFTSLMAETALTSFFNELTGVTPTPRKTLPTPPTSSMASKVKTPNLFSKPIQSYTPVTVSPPSPASSQLSSAKTFERYVVGVKEIDEELLLGTPIVKNHVISPYPNSATSVEQVLVNGYIIQTSLEFVSFSTVNKLYIIPYARLRIVSAKETTTEKVGFAGGISLETYLLGIPFCPSPSTLSNPNEIESQVQICLEIGNVPADDAFASIESSIGGGFPTPPDNTVTTQEKLFPLPDAFISQAFLTPPSNTVSPQDTLNVSISPYISTSPP
ncbi:hypothetical protein AFV7_gp41 [Betalipothrixvirus pezzuloense]|uniref:Uncharacterized protein n=1 Tax=Betalipothrixvirus pezzuloense TaxID=346883 RepID=A7WKS6_9VIRU|nr:hypothetical protein AFV7_gp41 [Acidianus filamentous virus 7]CAK29679.1 conserved hypothetical protein [Acidianus filamentous virus 7]